MSTARNGLLIDGPLARWHPLAVAFGVLLAGLAAYMAIGGIALIALLVMQGASAMELSIRGPELMAESTTLFFAGNAVGLALGLGVLAVLVARLQSTDPWGLLRLRVPELSGMGLALVGLLALIPVLGWLGMLNERLPVPEFIRAMEEEQLVLLEAALAGDVNLVVTLVLVALTPALFEEVFFRGLIQRNFERAWGGAVGIAMSGVVFGLFHFRLTQALPLIVLGVYMAYLAWRTGSLWVPVLVHFINNALALIVSAMAKEELGMDLDTLASSVMPWYVAVLGAVLFVAVIVVLQRRN